VRVTTESVSHGVALPLLRAVGEALGRLGADPAAFAVRLGALPTDGPDRTFDAAVVERAFDDTAKALGDDALAISLTQVCPPGAFGFIDYCGVSSSNLREGMHRVARYMHLLTSRLAVSVTEERGVARFEQHATTTPIVSVLAELNLAVITRRCRETAGPKFVLKKVSFAHHAPATTKRYTTFFGAPVEFDAPRQALYFDPTVLDLPLATSNQAVAKVLTEHGERLSTHIAGDGLIDRVRAAIADRLRDGAPSLQQIAKELGTSTRTLQRRLLEEKTSHKALTDTVRKELALRMLRTQATQVTEVAFMLGFSDPAAFFRAFRRWTGTTTTAYRSALGRTVQ
jgi:AraC-like DNA-binding protein